MRSLALLFLLCGCLSAQPASFAGTVVDAIAQRPLAGAHITLTGVVPFGNPIPTYGATSGEDGHFSIPKLAPAVYSLSAQRNGFVYIQEDHQEPLERRIALRAGDAITDRTVEMAPSAVITGRVVDAYGDPVENAYVRATRVGGNSPISIVEDRMFSPTDERGEFRIVGAPGEFYVSATKQPGRVALREIRTDGSEIPVYGETWHREAESRAKAVVVEAVAGRETTGIDIRLVRKKSLHISGVVTGTPDGSARAQVFLHTKSLGMPPATADADGRFTFSGLAPDEYQLTARYEAGALELMSRTVEVRLEVAEDHSVNLELAAGEGVSGNVEMEGTAQGLKVRLDALTQMQGVEMKGGEVDRTGNFNITPVYPGRFRVRVDTMPENAYIRTVRVDGEAVADTAIDFTRGVKGAKLKITVGVNGGSVEGLVSSEDGKPACCAMVVLAEKAEYVNYHMKAVKAGEKYRFTGLRPGKYRLIVSGPAQEFGTQTAETLFSKAPEIEVHEGDRITRDVTFKPRGSASEKH